MTFSFIVPVYNTEKYLAKCLDSLLSQSYQDFEILVVNDGSPDSSQAIIDQYVTQYPKKVKAFIKENGGLSDARNFGVQRASGEYMLFIDSDDYISPDLLACLSAASQNGTADVIRFSAQFVYSDGSSGQIISAPQMSGVSGEDALDRLIDHKQFFEAACFYAYRRAYWQENGFRYALGMYHEDFGLTPEIIMKTKKFTAIEHIGYFYVQAPGSIMRSANPEKDRKRAFDGLSHFDLLREVASQVLHNQATYKKFLSYIANSMVVRLDHISGTAKEEYLQAIRQRKVFDLLLDDTCKRRLKKLFIKLKYDRPVKE